MTNSLLKNQKSQILELLDSEASVGIILGESQSIDTVAAALGLYLTLEQMGKNVQIISKKDPIVEVSNLFGVDQIGHSFDGLTKIVTIAVPYREGEIEKVSYNIEGDKLNVNLFAETNGINFDERDVQYIKKGSSPSLIITIGVLDETELTSFVDPKSVRTIHIDRSPMNNLIGDVNLIDPAFSSVSEIVTSLIMEAALDIDLDAFQNLMDGITFATRNFTHPTTSAFAFEAAGFLLQNGAKRKEKKEDIRSTNAQDSFPKEDYFLNSRPQGQSGQSGQSQRGQNQSVPQNQNRNQNQAGPVRNQNQSNNPKLKFNAPSQNQNPSPTVQNQPVAATNRPQMAPQMPPASSAQPTQNPSLDSFADDIFNTPNINKASGETENAASDEIPDDWFLPKVFKGSRKGN